MSTAGTYPGNCNYCHNTRLGDPGPTVENTGPFAPVNVYRNDVTHHETGFFQQQAPNAKCTWCHNAGGPPNALSIRTCENCHDLSTIHNIQYDSTPATPVVPGSEPAGFGHVGAQSDCWGCHGNNGQTIGGAAGAEMTTGTVPGLYTTSFLTAKAGASNPITLAGNGFISTDDWGELYQSKLLLTARIGGASTTIAGAGTSDALTATVPSTLAPGNYKVQAMKDALGIQKSNPFVIALTPNIAISSATCSSGNVTIAGSGFHVYENGETTVTGTYNGATLTGQVTSWTDSGIAAKFTVTTSGGKRGTTTTAVCPTSVTVTNVFDSGTKTVTVSGGTGGKPRK